MIAFALYGLYGTENEQSTLACLMWASLFLTGLGSAIYHGTANELFASLDGLPMLMIITFGLVALFNEINYEKTSIRARNYVKSTLSVLFMAYFLSSIMGEQYGKGTAFFRVSFAIPMVIFIFTMVYLYVKIEDFYTYDNRRTKSALRQLIIRGWASGFTAFAFWLLDLLLCTQLNYVILFGHWVWHILIGYFAMCLITLVNYLEANNDNKKPVLKFQFFGIFPQSYYDEGTSGP
jgi:hypothetical protein